MKLPFSLLLVAGLLTCLSQQARARDIIWANAVMDELYDSQGIALDETFRFEVGMFSPSFNPAENPIDLWAANWIVFDLAFYDDTDPEAGWNVEEQYFAHLANHLSNGTSDSPYATPGAIFPQGTQAYLWVYNSKDISLTSEWALLTDSGGDWQFPAFTSETNAMPVNWALSELDTAVFGALGSGSSIGDGSVSNQPGSYSLQTYQVPEPGGALLIASAGLLFMLRRARLLRR